MLVMEHCSLLPDDFVMPKCKNCNNSLVYSSTGYSHKGIFHSCGCLKCRALYDINNEGKIKRTIIKGRKCV